MRTAAVIQSVTGGLAGDEYTAVVAQVYDRIVAFGPEATDPVTWQQITAAHGDLSLMPNAELTPPAVAAVLAAMTPPTEEGAR